MNARASGNSAARSRPSSISTRVFPTPPGPVIVTTRCVRTRSVSAASSPVRPTSGTAGVGRRLGRLAKRSPFPSSALASGTTKPSADTANSSKARPTFLSLNRPNGTATTSLRFLICSYAASDNKTPPGTANDSIRAATLTASPVNRSGSTTTSPLCTPIRTSTSSGASSC